METLFANPPTLLTALNLNMLNDDWSSNLEKYKVKQEQRNGELFNGYRVFYLCKTKSFRDGLYKVNVLNTTELYTLKRLRQ